MHTTMVLDQVKSQKIQARVHVSRQEDTKVIFSTGSTFEEFILFVSVLNRNIVAKDEGNDGVKVSCVLEKVVVRMRRRYGGVMVEEEDEEDIEFRVIAFEDFSVPHMGGALFRMLKKVFVNFHLKDKILPITLDNASNNTKAIGKLALRYGPHMDAGASAASSSRSHSTRNLMTNLYNKLKEKPNKRARRDILATSEYERTRLTLASLEMCMCLKDYLGATERIQHTSNLKNDLDFKKEILEEEVRENEAMPLLDEEIALDEAASKARCKDQCKMKIQKPSSSFFHTRRVDFSNRCLGEWWKSNSENVLNKALKSDQSLMLRIEIILSLNLGGFKHLNTLEVVLNYANVDIHDPDVRDREPISHSTTHGVTHYNCGHGGHILILFMLAYLSLIYNDYDTFYNSLCNSMFEHKRSREGFAMLYRSVCSQKLMQKKSFFSEVATESRGQAKPCFKTAASKDVVSRRA
uniref:Zinc finger BED domain-containing protein RICESLEEPER 2-like n=1 Tax=Tanacetum cinerariifolium TaxID=118510 RepID=A0A6L2JEX4_TANCI|nr:zinc finger BED domain-containing protein RICESLEEPER 2-like [Tanacetum cinerariifolium]